ncbi:antibiotic biosynthesis monooxygenase [Pectobacterium brasiliense]|uniref:putative quinol monooxygenase n=1 Tax=Pectobacterium TaxID=122277 RepID=UPI00057F2072|nr:MULTISPECIES: putative quinol monooxygenase [Pectobacterium]KHS66714.1 antibiotic biosynthesis monooxygenase [Pectobacterium brasiliense]MBA0195166.1 antibiotic biosynthesis monooxygenase [Pectobacterium brasiliense]MBA0212599.1 antibiotic biosynthesis monooxygenase [Pectobacterium brasiliense]MBN3054211.1 antibiotic biosynthesis monooxygenase [Pectobacterium brasiliense]MBN3092617.1 antibiotic biosynthesis monooxygenase [Pectobacterium brasiliense]
MEIRIVATIQAKAEFVADVTATLKRVVAPSRQEAGNVQYDLHEVVDKSGSFVFFERWKDRDALASHEQSDHFKNLLAELDGKTDSVDIKLLNLLG